MTPDRQYWIERRRSLLTEAKAIEAYLKGSMNDRAFQAELRKAASQRSAADQNYPPTNSNSCTSKSGSR